MLLADFQVPPAADDGLIELAHHLEGVAQVTGSLGFPKSVAHGTSQGQVVFVILKYKNIKLAASVHEIVCFRAGGPLGPGGLEEVLPLRFQQVHDQGLRYLFLMVSEDLHS